MILNSKKESEKKLRLEIAGRLDMLGNQKFELEINSLTDPSIQYMKIDLSEVSYIASVGLRTFITLAKTLSERHGALSLLNPQPQIQELFETVGPNKLIKIEIAG